MIAKNCSAEDLQAALDKINRERYEGNIKFLRLDGLNQNSTRWRFTLTVHSSKGAGSRLTVRHPWAGYKQHRLAAACWHVHGYFFEALFGINPGAEISTGRVKSITKQEGNWQDYNIGSMAAPMYFSDACCCDK
jgi:hypothetical protein